MSPVEDNAEIRELPLERISPNPFQPRRVFDEASLRELADSIRDHGVIQAVTVRPRGGNYELVVGERRFRAAKLAGLQEIPAVVRDLADTDLMEIAIIENLQREDLNPVDEAEGFRQLMERLSYTQEKLAERVGKSRPYVANSLRLLSLPEDILSHVSRETISAGHARAILSTPPGGRRMLLEKILSGNCTVRQAEALAKAMHEGVSRETKKKPVDASLDSEWRSLQRRLEERLQARVSIKRRGGRGSIEINYHSHDELERLLDILGIRE
jgi:ParB family chromosome partitioning protein